jgi:hypothetical protein
MQVFPKNDDVRRVLYHPSAGHFRAEGPADWPDDAFTNRRIKDGDITKEEAPPEGRHGKEEKPKFSRKSE